MQNLSIKAGVIFLGFSLWSAAWAEPGKPCTNCPADKAIAGQGVKDKRFKFSGDLAVPTAPPVLPKTQSKPIDKKSSIFGDGSTISKEFRVTEEKAPAYSGTRSVTTSNGDINFTITDDRRNPNTRARHQSIFESGGNRNGQPPGLPYGPTVEDLMNGNRNFRR